MHNEKFIRYIILAITALLHLLLIFFLAFDVPSKIGWENSESAKVMKLADFTVTLPPPQFNRNDLPLVETIAENMIETDSVPEQNVVAAGTLDGDYLPMHLVSILPRFSEDELIRRIIYPPIAQRSELEGMVYLEIFVDAGGIVRNVAILKEDPPGRGFGEAAVKAFTGFSGSPAMANGKAVAVRYRYPVRFTLR